MSEAPELPEPAEKQWFFCNKCGSSGEGKGWTHNRRDGSECGYIAQARGPYYTADQMRAYALSAITQLQARLETVQAELDAERRRLDWLLPNLHPATWGMEFPGGYEWDSDAEFLAKWRAAIDASLHLET